MISDDELSQLSVDPELAFVQFEKLCRSRLQEEEGRSHDADSNADHFRKEYMNKVAAAAKMYNIEALSDLTLPSVNLNRSLFYSVYDQFMHDVDFVTMQIRIRNAQSNRQGSVGLNDTMRAKIHHFIAQIKEIIGQSDLPLDKREALFEKLNKFAAEVDKIRTALQAGMAVYIAVCDALGQGFVKLEPARKWLDSIGAMLGGAKDAEETAEQRLPAPAERKRLEPPPKAVGRTDAQIDDEIPF